MKLSPGDPQGPRTEVTTEARQGIGVGELAEGDAEGNPTEEGAGKPKLKKKAQVQLAEDGDAGVEELEAELSKPRIKGEAKSTIPQESTSDVPKSCGRETKKTSTRMFGADDVCGGCSSSPLPRRVDWNLGD